jgi:ATP-dependent exoDNAse (exonuclease V) beta subunit
VVAIGDVTSAGGGRDSLLVDPELGVLLPLKEDSEVAAVYRLAKLRNDDQDAAERSRLFYVAATRAEEMVLMSGCVTKRQNGSLSRLGPWLEAMTNANGFELDEIRIAGDDGGGEAKRFAWVVDGQQIQCNLYDSSHESRWRRPKLGPPAEEPADLPPMLLEPVQSSGAGRDGPERERDWTLWRVVPDDRWEAPPRLVGSLVHEALAAWLFPGPEFNNWITARAHRYGLHDGGRVRAVAARVVDLLQRLRDHWLYDEMAGAERRLHEVPYSLTVDGQVESGMIDVLYQRDGKWTIVELKTTRTRAAAGAQPIWEDEAVRAQSERYLRAMRTLVGGQIRFALCVLDCAGEVHVEVLS